VAERNLAEWRDLHEFLSMSCPSTAEIGREIVPKRCKPPVTESTEKMQLVPSDLNGAGIYLGGPDRWFKTLQL